MEYGEQSEDLWFLRDAAWMHPAMTAIDSRSLSMVSPEIERLVIPAPEPESRETERTTFYGLVNPVRPKYEQNNETSLISLST
jgi:hypothetical protein